MRPVGRPATSTMIQITFKADPETRAALERLVADASKTSRFDSRVGQRSAILRAIILAADKRGFARDPFNE